MEGAGVHQFRLVVCLPGAFLCAAMATLLAISTAEATVIKIGQPYKSPQGLQAEDDVTATIFLAHRIPSDGVLFKLAVYLLSTEPFYIQIWRPSDVSNQYKLAFTKPFKATKVNALNTFDVTLDQRDDDTECPAVSSGDYIGLYSSGVLPIPFYRRSNFSLVFYRQVPAPPSEGQNVTFRELTPGGRIQFVIQTYLWTRGADRGGEMEPTRHRGPPEDRGRMMCPAEMWSFYPNQPIGSTLTVGMTSPQNPVNTRDLNEQNNQNDAHVSVSLLGEEGPTPPPPADGDTVLVDSNPGTDGKIGSSGLSVSNEEFYIIIGALALVVVVVIAAVIVCFVCRKGNSNASPLPDSLPGGATMQPLKKTGLHIDIPSEPRYDVGGPQNGRRDLSQLRDGSEPSAYAPDEVYEEILDTDLMDVKPDPGISTKSDGGPPRVSGSAGSDSYISPTKQIPAGRPQLSGTQKDSTYLELKG